MWDMLFLKGCLTGLCLAVPVGPIGILCVHQSLVNGRKCGLAAGLGAAVADTVYGIIAGLGISAISVFIWHNSHWIHLIGSAFLIYLGLVILSSRNNERPIQTETKNLLSIFLTTFALTFSNPMTLLAMIALFASLGLSECSVSFIAPFIFSLGVFIGSALWWLILCYGVTTIFKAPSERFIRGLKITSGVVLIVLGIAAAIGGACF